MVAPVVTLALIASLFFAANQSAAVEESPVTEEAFDIVSTETTQASPSTDHSDQTADHEEGGGHGEFGTLFLFFAVLLISAKIGGIVEKFGQPAVLGELLAGIVLSLIAYLGVSQIDQIRHNEIFAFLAEIGAVILLFEIGLESNVRDLLKVGPNAVAVAIIGVVAPFVAGTFLVGPWLLPHAPNITHLFLGASMVATSVGITASVFKSLNILKNRSCQTVLGAAVIDDILGLLVLAIVSAIASGGDVSAGFIARLSLEAFAFLAGSLVLGGLIANQASNLFSKIHTGQGMKLALAFSFALGFAYLATLVGLAPIVGAFAAGLVLDAVHFKSFDAPTVSQALRELHIKISKRKKSAAQLNKIINHVNHTHIEDMISSLSLIFVPLFFAYTGLQIEIDSLLNPNVYLIAGIASVIAILGKVVAGLAAKGSLTERLLVGASMVPRGEVGLIFASIGKSLGALNAEAFSVIVLVVIITTFIAPPIIKILALKQKAEASPAVALT